MDRSNFLNNFLNDDLVKTKGKIRDYKKNFILETTGNKINEIGIVIEGYLKGVSYTKDGREICESIFSSSSIIVEYLFLSGVEYYKYDLVTLTKSEVLWIPTNIFKEIIYEDKINSRLYIEHLAKKGLENQRLINCLSYKTIRDRVCYWIISKDNSGIDFTKAPTEIEIDISQETLSELLCVSRASLNQELQKMEEEGLFKKNKNTLVKINKTEILKNL